MQRTSLLDERDDLERLTCGPEERVLEQLVGFNSVVRVLLEALANKVAEQGGPLASVLERGDALCGDQEQSLWEGCYLGEEKKKNLSLVL